MGGGAGTRSCACGRAPGAAGTALPAPRRHRDLFLCRDAPSPPPALPGRGEIRPIPGPRCHQGRDVTAAKMSPGARSWVGSDAQHRGWHNREPTRHHSPRFMVTRKGLVTSAHPGKGEPWGAAPGHRPGSPTPGWHRTRDAHDLPNPPGQPKPAVPAVPTARVPPCSVPHAVSPAWVRATVGAPQQSGLNVNGTLIRRRARLPAPDFPAR